METLHMAAAANNATPIERAVNTRNLSSVLAKTKRPICSGDDAYKPAELALELLREAAR